MKSAETAAPTFGLFAVELHSDQPERMVEFYERAFAVKFKATTYPFPRYIAELGQVALIIAAPAGCGGVTASPPGKITLNVLVPAGYPLKDGAKYPLHPARPLGGRYPDRDAFRFRDPDGHHVAFATASEHVGIPSTRRLGPLLGEIREHLLMRLFAARMSLYARRDALIDSWEYRSDRVVAVSRDLEGYSHLVATRHGLFAVNTDAYKRVMRGSFFGLTIKDGDAYCFQSCGQSTQNRGRILKLRVQGNRITDVSVVLKGLDDGCHQIDFVDDDLFIVDCYNGRLLRFRPGTPEPVAYYPLGRIDRETATGVHHMNSVVRHPDGSIWVLLHNNNKKHSEVLVLDEAFNVARRFSVDAAAAHNVVFTHDESEYLIADSRAGRIITARGPGVDDQLMLPRGISLDERTCVVGDVYFTPRQFRRYVAGRVHFFDPRTWVRTHSLTLPSAPTEIRRIDGRDASLSNSCAFTHTASLPLASSPSLS